MTSRRAHTGATAAGTVYTLHFDPPLGHARHYTGWTTDLDTRLAQHEAGQAARITQVQRERGGSWRVARTEPGTRDRENQLKERGASRDCPICMAERAEQEKEAGQ